MSFWSCFTRKAKGQAASTHEAVFGPPTVSFLLANRPRASDFYPQRPSPDTPLATINRIYVAIIVGQTIWLRNEVEHFGSSYTWPVQDIPDPKDTDPERYAVLAAITYLLVKALNRNIGLGVPRDSPGVYTDEEELEIRARPKTFEAVPSWAESLAPLEKQLLIPNPRGELPQDEYDEAADQDMLRKNILTTTLPVLFI